MSEKDTHIQAKLISAAAALKALAHPIRLDIIISLDNYEMSVNTLVEVLEIPQAKLSKHLAILRCAQIVDVRADGRTHFYRLKNPELTKQIIQIVSDRL